MGGSQSRARERTSGLAPGLILSQEIFNRSSGTVIAMALTSQPQRVGFPLNLELSSRGLPKKSWVKISQIRTLSVDRLGRKLGNVTPDELDQIIEGFNEIIGA